MTFTITQIQEVNELKCFRSTAGAILIFAAVFGFAGAAFCDYQFDDLYGPSGISYQWMVLNDAGETFGASHSTPINVSGDLLTTDNPVLNVLNGSSVSEVTDRSLNTFFLVVADEHGEFDMNFRAPSLAQQFDVATPNLALSTLVSENDVYYTDTKTSKGPVSGYDPLWRGYNFQIERYRNTGLYDTVVQYFYFQQNPNTAPSSGIPVPMVISNVHYGTASDVPLELRMTLRDSSNMEGNIAAYDVITWRVDDNYPPNNFDSYINEGQWVFVPVDDLNTDNTRIERLLTTEVVNHTAVRYGAYDGSTTNQWAYPSFWKFDIPRWQGTNYVARQFQLAQGSHIAPGLVTVYRRPYNVNESNKRPLRLFPIDDSRGTGTYDLRLNHKIIFGKRLGDTFRYSASEGRFSLYELTAYQPRPYSMTFYDDVARVTGSKGTVSVPSTLSLSANSVKHDFMPSDVLPGMYFTIDQSIPGNLRTSGTEGMLPLHITFNIPVTLVQSRTGWNNMLDAWRNGGQIADIFADYYNIYLLTQTDGKANPWNMTQELQNKGVYTDQVKVFLDEDRGRVTVDNDRGLLTVSFIVMLMNGTRDGLRPEMSLVSDNSTEQDNNYIVIRDGNTDNKWNMTFFIAPANYIINPDPIVIVSPDAAASGDKKNTETGGSGGGGGCNAGLAGLMGFAALVLALRKHEGR